MLFLFDSDGVLVDSEIIAAHVDSELLTELGAPISVEDVTRRFAGLTFRKTVELVEKETDKKLPETIFARQKKELEERLTKELKAIAGVERLLDRLDQLNVERCVCSSSTSERMRLTLGKTQLFDRFAPNIFSAVEVGDKEPKPSPNVYNHAAEHFGTPPRDCIVIEDSLFGVTAAREAGMRVVGFTGGGHTWPGHADVLTEAGAETVIDRLSDLPAVAEAFKVWGGLPD
jgi:HAD superfamily hydrolase (TIGR01509 family)